MDKADSTKSRIVLPWRLRHSIRVRVSKDGEDKAHEYHVVAPFRVGYDKHCEVPLPGASGPDTVFEFSPVSQPVHLSTPIRPELSKSNLSISVDGTPVTGPNLELATGSILNIQDRSGRNEVNVTVDIPEQVSQKLRILSILLFLGIITMSAYVIYSWLSLSRTQSRIEESEARISLTESGIEAQSARIQGILAQFETNELSTELALQKIDDVQRESMRELRNEFSKGIIAIRHEVQQDLSALAEDDIETREALAARTEQDIERLRSDITEKLLESHQRLQLAQQDVLLKNTARLESLEFKNQRFKSILANSMDAVIFVRTSFTAFVVSTGETRSLDSSGTGFIVSKSGVALTPQHVFSPWLYDENLQALIAIGMLEIIPESVRHSIWTAGQQVISLESDSMNYLLESAFTEGAKNQAIQLLHAPEPDRVPQQLTSPFGLVEVQSPLPGPSDVAVIQLIDFSQEFTALTIDSGETVIEPLDEVLLLGYPLSRLSDGQSIPQAVRGFIRRPATEDLLELHSAVHPGTSGAPVLNAQGSVIGMAIAMLGSDSYGAAIPYTELQKSIATATSAVNDLERQVRERGCDAGSLDGHLDETLWQALQDPKCQPDTIRSK